MRVLFWFCNKFAWTPTIKTLDDVPDSGPEQLENVVVAFVHVEPKDIQEDSSAETKLVKNAKWLARKWDVKKILFLDYFSLPRKLSWIMRRKIFVCGFLNVTFLIALPSYI